MHDPTRYQPTTRFSDRVQDYERARPGYPAALVPWLIKQATLVPGDPVADLGAGTGLFSRDLLAAGLQVYGVEPNAVMRGAAERAFAERPNFISVDGRAEATTLATGSVKLVTAAQAYHWFEPEPTYREARRILAPGGIAALIWNVRRVDTGFGKDYEELLMTHCPAYVEGQPHQAAPEEIAAFFAPAVPITQSFEYRQTFDYEMLKARLLSSSYTPKEGDPARAAVLAALRRLYDNHAQYDSIQFHYDCRVFASPIADMR
jgi:SAM-dependent methyltransferase